MRFLVIDGCPCPADIAPYVYLVLREANQTANSIYRGDDPAAVAILHRHGKHTQAEIHRMMPAISNPPGRSSHELRSDGAGYPGPVGRHMATWEIGIDSGGDDAASKRAINRAAARLGWSTRHPYSRGVEGHHWSFAQRPRPTLSQRARILHLRATLPRR